MYKKARLRNEGDQWDAAGQAQKKSLIKWSVGIERTELKRHTKGEERKGGE